MKIAIEPKLSDSHIDAERLSSQRQLLLSLSAIADVGRENLPLNLCLILDCSGSMQGRPLETVKAAAIRIIEQLNFRDRLSVVAFNHQAKVLVRNQLVGDTILLKKQIETLEAGGGTAIDEGLVLGMREIAMGRKNTNSQVFLLTDGENEHGEDNRCLKITELAAEYNITLNTLGFGSHWNQYILEKIADRSGGVLAYIETPELALSEFTRLFQRIKSVTLTNAHLIVKLDPSVRLAEFKPVAQIAPETIELLVNREGKGFAVRLGDLMNDNPRTVLINLYLNKLNPGSQTIARVRVRYDDPATDEVNLLSETIPIEVEVQNNYIPAPNREVERAILTLAKYRQTEMAEAKLRQGDRAGAATMLQTAAQTALQLGDREGATVLQTSATRLQVGENLSEAEQKKTKIVSKTILRGSKQ